MPLTCIPSHTHLNKNGHSSEVESSPTLNVPKFLIDPNTKLNRVQKLASCVPILGLFIVGRLLYQKSLMNTEYAKLSYTPNEKCRNPTCSSLDPSHFNLPVGIAAFGGLGLLFPFMILVGFALLIMALYSKITSYCRRSQSYESMESIS
ncbi:hypothetical protein [Chlamydia sp. 04-14]|uniref:hypothetical protein n=1 Tax=Chlamydia TaxID=810 RepID=UPI002FC5F20C